LAKGDGALPGATASITIGAWSAVAGTLGSEAEPMIIGDALENTANEFACEEPMIIGAALATIDGALGLGDKSPEGRSILADRRDFVGDGCRFLPACERWE
jgi:hypothetical protein